MSAERDYAMPQPQPYVGPKEEYVKEDIRHIEEVPSDGGLDTKDGTSSPVDHYTGFAPRQPYSGRWARLREFVREPPIPPGEHITRYPNRWSRLREIMREPAAEFFGTMIILLFGAGVDAQVTLSGNTAVAPGPKGDYLSINIAWAAGVACGVWVAGGYSGGHLNPAVTLTLAVFRDFPWKKVPIYWFAQLMGALVGAAIIYGDYIRAIDIFEGGRHIRTVPGTASIFSTYALSYMPSVNCFFDEFIGTCLLLIIVFAVTDRNNAPPPAGLVPLCYAINPARDLGPRIFTAMVGYGKEVFNYRNQYWLWCPVIAPLCGGLVGGLFYDVFFFTGSESIINRPDARARRAHAHALAAERAKPGVPGVEIV
ncbi:hypothetical protein NM688_g3384 [Phlebia brevispora]|uniref:Uncharacterized protein n=1 Tax=Phlebia brevispora TaxID=194682 RepID=A0ACC1T639_9APHY|nr:hypothetical protein NM688_g3384 [Phlebia brevispora]